MSNIIQAGPQSDDVNDTVEDAIKENTMLKIPMATGSINCISINSISNNMSIYYT